MMPLEELKEMERALDEATPGKWEWWTSNSWRRLSVAGGKDGGVLCPYKSRADGHPDCAIREADMRLIENTPTWLRRLLEERKELVAEVERLRPLEKIKNFKTVLGYLDDLKESRRERDIAVEALTKAHCAIKEIEKRATDLGFSSIAYLAAAHRLDTGAAIKQLEQH